MRRMSIAEHLQSADDGRVRPWPTALVELGAGVYAYIQAEGSSGISNAGVLIGEEDVTLIDTLVTSPRALAFREEFRRHTDLPVRRIIFTHHHIDHVVGTEHFLPATIIAQHRCREAMLETGLQFHHEFVKRRTQFADGVKPIRSLHLPTITFSHELLIQDGRRQIELRHFGTAHTVGDTVVHIPDARVLFVGDLLFYGVAPQPFQGVVGKWIGVIEKLLAYDVDVIVPGHGPITDRRGLRTMYDMLTFIYGVARRDFDAGLSPQQSLARMDVGPWSSWCELDERLPITVERCYAEFRSELDDI
jgi:cyclase